MSAPVAYMARTRAYYQALGYGAPYRWAQFDTVPFTRLPRPLSEARVGIVTTAAPFQKGKGEQGPGAPYNAAAKFFEVFAAPIAPMPDLRISHIAIDRDHCRADDIGTYFPLVAAQRAANAGIIGTVSPRFYGLPTNRSQETTRDVDCRHLVQLCAEDAIDVAVLVPNCPVCHQSVSLAARSLEAAGIATVIMGAAQDIVEHVGVPRLLFSDLPLGHAAGPPDDPEAQYDTLLRALALITGAGGPRTTAVSPHGWPGDPNWKQDYANAERLTPAEIAARKAAFDQGKATAAAVRSRKE